ncbi:response regulator transcription factor [Saccharothrix longispora]|uniref:response regulator transcription factor n=1 Tax=Saccharothrix longispora TaxID=33920 RepID=UPI0028FD1AC1|nr:response regulator transcription factor [Saccharothrix longispora]MBY8850283.1 response regulator transcription factor [Saccharothrix sp. MB29]MDU0294481.1 response regulator transcription factor [Saccharothrix longispora]
MTIGVLIADDQEMMRSAYGMILGAQPDMEVVASVGDGESAVAEARRLRPDVCLLDIRMPGIDGLEATRLLAGPGTRDPLNVLIATTFDLDEYVYRALRNGACGFLLKDMSPALLVEAVRAAATGASMISPNVTVRLLSHLAPDRGTQEPPERAPHEPLTERELAVVRLVALGRTNDEVAAELYVTVATVKTHLGNVQRKLSARNRVEVAAWAWRTGVVRGR